MTLPNAIKFNIHSFETRQNVDFLIPYAKNFWHAPLPTNTYTKVEHSYATELRRGLVVDACGSTYPCPINIFQWMIFQSCLKNNIFMKFFVIKNCLKMNHTEMRVTFQRSYSIYLECNEFLNASELLEKCI